MRLSVPTLLLTGLLAGTSRAEYGSQRASRPTIAKDTPPETHKFILEFAEGTDYDHAVQELRSRSGVKVLKQLKSDVFSGVSIESVGASPEELRDIPVVSTAWRSKVIKLTPTVQMTSFSDGAAASNYSVHSMTGVDKLHAAGILGKGVKVAIVDTGVDYTHPALGGGFGPGFKVGGGYDFIGDSKWPNEPSKNADKDPMDVMGHGTHVAGIVAGNNDWFKGAAPEATILAYKVFGEVDYTDEETLIEAFVMAYNDGADIITSSIGEPYNWANGAWATVASRLVDKGVVVTIAAGNDGEAGPFRGSSGSSGENVLAVASVDPSTLAATPIMASSVLNGKTESIRVAYRPGPVEIPAAFKDVPVYALSLNTTVADDACRALTEKTPDLSKSIVLVRRSELCMDDVQSRNLAPLNPKAIVFYHNDDVEYYDPWSELQIPMGAIPADAGVYIINMIIDGGEVTLDFSPLDGLVSMPYNGGAIPSFFTSWGGLWDLTLKPDVAAPGALITSTYLGGTFETMSGTSMATPYVAGVAALYIGLHGGRKVHGDGFAKMLHGRIVASGTALPWPGKNDGGQYLASPTQLGTGLLDAVKILNYTTQLSFAKFSLNDTHHFSRYQNVDITNNGDEEVTYTFSVQDAGAYDAMNNDPKLGWVPTMNTIGGVRTYKLKPDVRFPAGTFKVKPGQTRKAEFIFKIPELPAGRKTENLPVLSGKILIRGSNGEQLSVPYFSVLADVKKEIRKSNLYTTALEWPKIQMAGSWKTIDERPYWNFDVSLYGPTPQDLPVLQVAVIFGTPELRWDIYEANWSERNWKWPPVVGENGYIGSVAAFRQSEKFWFDPATDDMDDVVALPTYNLNRNQLYVSMWLGRLANGSDIVPGNYTMRIAALLPFGDRQAADNWQVMKNPQIQILPKPPLAPAPTTTPTPDPNEPIITLIGRRAEPVETQRAQIR